MLKCLIYYTVWKWGLGCQPIRMKDYSATWTVHIMAYDIMVAYAFFFNILAHFKQKVARITSCYEDQVSKHQCLWCIPSYMYTTYSSIYAIVISIAVLFQLEKSAHSLSCVRFVEIHLTTPTNLHVKEKSLLQNIKFGKYKCMHDEAEQMVE